MTAPKHEIFSRPLEVKIETEERPTPENYRQYPEGAALGAKMAVWKVQTRSFPDVDPGLVSDGYGFEDSPDAEKITGGVNSKGSESVAIGRHGNFFLWGFSGSPTEMTPEARKCFVNSVCYIRRFDGRAPLARKESRSRRWAAAYANYLKDPQLKGSAEYLLKLFPKEARAAAGDDPEKLAAFVAENLECLTLDGQGKILVDADAKTLGISNRDVRLLDRCVELLQKEGEAERARRLLKRYTGLAFEEPAKWKEWLEANRPRLFFTDLGGYRFVVGSEAEAGGQSTR